MRRAALALLASLALLTTTWGAPARAAAPDVVVSIKPLHSLVAALMKNVGQPRLVVRGAKTPLDFTPPADLAAELAGADLVIWTGPELEPFLIEPVEALPATVPALAALDIPELKILPARNAAQTRDPFLWTDVRNMEMLVDGFARALAQIDPANAAAFEANRAALIQDIARLDREFEFGFRKVAGGVGFLYHDTQQYFGQAYAFKTFAPLAPEVGEMAAAARLLDGRTVVSEAGAACVFVEKGLTRQGLSMMVEGTGAQVVELDTFGVGLKPGPALYPALMRSNFTAISGCFADLPARLH